VAEVVSARLAHGVEIDTMQQLLAKLLTLSTRFFERHSQGDLVMATYFDVQQVRQVTLSVGSILLHLSRLIGLLGVAYVLSPKLMIVGLITVPLGALPALWLGERIQQAARRERGAVRWLYDSFLQVSSGIRVVKVNNGEALVLERAREIGRGLFEHLVNQARARSLARFLLESMSGVGLIAVLVIGGKDVAAGTLSWQSLLSLLIAVMGVYSPTVGILQVYAQLRSSLPHLDRVAEVMAAQPEIQDVPNARRLSTAPATIELRDVGFAYDDQPVLHSVSASFSRGETIGIVGPSGSGKTTLLSLLLRLYDPTAGRILLDGVDLREFRHADLMSVSAIVLQEPFLFVDTVAANIRLSRPDASMEDVMHAAAAANVHEEIMAMERGYETIVGRSEDARGVSTGQKQRICIAGALLKNAPLLFLDEATSSLDSVSERRLQAAIERLMEGRTTFMIAHRLSTLRGADRILVLDQGRVVGLGTHEELLARCRTYQRLWHSQEMDAPPAPPPPGLRVV
jgi:subfamily B ATP-binding cassette protein MsbA